MFIVIKRSQIIIVLALVLVLLLLLLIRIPRVSRVSGPIFKGNPDKKAVAFCINVAWGNEYIPAILETLKKNNCYATFFFVGTWVKDYPDLGRTIARAGHEIGNHGYYHLHPASLTKDQLQELIIENEKILNQEFGRTAKLFAPPYGEFNKKIVAFAEEIGYKTVMWTIDTIDWKNPAPEVLVKRVLNNLQNGALILAHPTEVTAKTLPLLISEIKKRGYEIVTVSELI